MKLKCVIEVPDNDYRTKLDAMAKAGRDESLWTYVQSRDELKKKTSLENKCGSCKHFKPITLALSTSKCYGDCLKGRPGYRQRTCRGCKAYERIENG